MRDVVYGPQGELDWRVWTIELREIMVFGNERGNEDYYGGSSGQWKKSLTMGVDDLGEHEAQRGVRARCKARLGRTRKTGSRSESSGKEVVAVRARVG
jgi:hypothetical protein